MRHIKVFCFALWLVLCSSIAVNGQSEASLSSRVTRRVDSGVQLQTAPGLNHTDGWTNECDVVLEPSLPVLH